MDYEKKYRESLKKAEAFYYSATTEPITEREVLANIFPELKESGDEKIRKNIIIALKSQKDELEDFYKSHNTSESELVNWLEKQGEKPQGKTYIFEGKSVLEAINKEKVEPKFKVGDMVNKNDREDEEHCILTITSVNIDEHCYICNQCSVIDFGEQDLWHIVEQKPAWREEDETTKNNISHIIRHYDKISKRENQPCYYVGDCLLWMQNIKDRVQPKQEWSEDDKERIKNIISVLDVQVCWDGATGKKGNPYQKEIDWLKSLKDRYTWKPSDEQMKALRFVKKAKILDPEERESLNSLYMHLKKLK